MAQLQNSVAAPTISRPGGQTFRPGRLAAISIGLMVLFAFAAATAYLAYTQPQNAAPAVDQAEAIDGWLPGITAANEARRLQQADANVDGWLPAITSAGEARAIQRANANVDGWMPGSLSNVED